MAYRCIKCNAYYLLSCLRAKFDYDDFNSVRGIVCEGHTHRQADAYSLVYIIIFKVV